MMQMNNNTPLCRTHWGMPRYNNNKKAPSKKVVSIPVHFVGSDSDSERRRTDSAMKIQKVVRGFLVRSTMRRIKAIRVEVEQIESKVSTPETKEVMKRDQKERVRVSETIMNLLLRLDSVRVLNYYSGVRDCRKAVIKKAIALQEMVDQMVGPTHQDQDADADAEEDGSVVVSEGKIKLEALGNEEEKMEMEVEEKEKEEDGEVVGPTDDQDQTKVVSNQEEAHHEDEDEDEDADVEDSVGSVGASSEMILADFEGKKIEGLGNKEEKMEVEEKEEEDGEGEGMGEESVGTSLVEEVEENCLVKEEEEDCKGGRGEEGDHGNNNNNRELLERMMEDNERMMGMMAQLFERNEMQTRILSSLSHRVEQLERAFACEKLRRKKRRNADAKHKETEHKNGCI